MSFRISGQNLDVGTALRDRITDRIVDEAEEFLTGSRGGVEPDRVLATVLFTDIVDSTGRAAASSVSSSARDRSRSKWRHAIAAKHESQYHCQR